VIALPDQPPERLAHQLRGCRRVFRTQRNRSDSASECQSREPAPDARRGQPALRHCGAPGRDLLRRRRHWRPAPRCGEILPCPPARGV